jgi:RNA polymerase sigma-54 factor
MQLSQSVRLKQKQSMVMTPRLQQAIRMLQMSNLDLTQYLADQALENPFLEVEGESDRMEPIQQEQAEAADSPIANDAEALDTAIQTGASNADDPTQNGDFENRFESADSDAVWKADVSTGSSGVDWDTLTANVANRSDSIYTHVGRQIDMVFTTSRERMMAQLLLESLQPSGWLGRPVEEIAGEAGVDQEDLDDVLSVMQGFEPSGLFARGLVECMQIQARDQGLLTPDLELFLQHLPLLAAGEMRSLMRKCKCDETRIQELLRLVRSFNPKPGEEFIFADQQITSPDLIAHKGKDGWIVELNNSTLPAIVINEAFAAELAERKAAKEAEEFTQNAVSSARWLKRALEQRNSTTLLITAEIIKQQTAFLEDGLNALKPLLLRDVAKAISMHESTVSRVTTGLMISTPRGSFPLKSFFSVALAGQEDDAEGGASAVAVRQMIRKMVAEESPKSPLSDDAIAAKVTASGVRLARRTVAKYRQILKIPSSAERRRLAKIAHYS